MSVGQLLRSFDVHPVLVDLGASGDPPEIWTRIAPHSIYVGFDPDQRGLQACADDVFFARQIVPRAVTADDSDVATLYLTRFSYCSSTLEPDHEFLRSYLMAPLFEVESTTTVPASRLGPALAELGIDRVDWFKADTQGTDLRIFMSLSESMRERVLAVDVEPGLDRVYRGEDRFGETHAALTAQGFWLSRLNVKGSIRITEASKRELDTSTAAFAERAAASGMRESPAWCEARYLRTTDSLADQDERAWVLSWVFALVDDQPGFALDLVRGFEAKFDNPQVASTMRQAAIASVSGRLRASPIRRAWRRLTPISIRRALFKARTWLSPTS